MRRILLIRPSPQVLLGIVVEVGLLLPSVSEQGLADGLLDVGTDGLHAVAVLVVALAGEEADDCPLSTRESL